MRATSCASVSKMRGSGFKPQDEVRLFDAFYTAKNGGMGIGLSVSRSIIESHRGRLWAALNDGPGATFSFSIPRRSERSKVRRPSWNCMDTRGDRYATRMRYS